MLLRHVLLFLRLLTVVCLTPGARGAICYGITSENLVITFDSADPGGSVTTGGTLSGLGIGETILGIDVRPNGVLYLLTRNPSGIGILYSVNPNTAVATFRTATDRTIPGALHGIDFDPVSGRLRVIGSDGSNMTIHPDTGLTLVDGPLIYPAGDPGAGIFPTIFSAAYTSSIGGQPVALYAIDNGTDTLVRIDPAENGILHTVGPVGMDLGGGVALDVANSPLNHAYAAISTGLGQTSLFHIDLESGRAILIGKVGGDTVDLDLLAFCVAPNYQFTGFSRNQTIRIVSGPEGFQVLGYNYTTGEVRISPYSNVSSAVPRFFPFVEWTGDFLYDYASGRFTQATYSRQHSL